MILPPASRRLAVNIGSSYANVALMALITLLVVPIYVHTLGASQWGMVALCMTLQGVLFSIDVALGPLMLRDIARAVPHGRQHTTYMRFLRIYGGFALSIFVLAELAVVGLQHLPAAAARPIDSELTWAIRIVLIQFLFQFSNNAAIGYWNGQEQQRFANLRLAGFTLAKHGIALLLVTQWAATAIVYLAPFAAISAIEFFLNFRHVRLGTRGIIAHRQPDQGATSDLAGSTPATSDWGGFAGYGFAASLGVLTTQIDRVFLSLNLPAEQYGIYYLICSLMLSLLQLQVPIHRAFLPRMATTDTPQREVTAMLRVSVALLVLPSLAMALFPEWVLRLWLHDAYIAAVGATPLRLMLIAVALIALYAPSSALLLSQQRYRILIVINGSVLLVQLLLLLTLTPMVGMTAGACAWLGCGLIQVLFAGFIWRASRGNQSAATATPP